MLENKTKLGQEPAFPIEKQLNYGNHGLLPESENGMSKRFYAAVEITKAIFANKSTVTIENGLAVNEVAMAYAIADELLRQE